MQALTCMLVTFVLAVKGQNDANSTDSSDDGLDNGNNTGMIVATSLVVSLVLVIVVALTITMWICACCRPEKAFKTSARQTNKWPWKSTMHQPASSNIEGLPVVGLVEADDKRKSLDISRIGSMDVEESKVWRSNENLVMDGSCGDLYASQNYIHSMNYSESENDFQTLKLDEALFENPSSRSRSEAQLSSVVFSKTTGLQTKAKAKKLDDLSSEKMLEFYDLQTPKNSPRRKYKASCSTGDLINEPSPVPSLKKVGPVSKQTESPLVNQQQEQVVTVTIEQTEDDINVEQTDGKENYEQMTASNCTRDQIEPVDTNSLQEDSVSCTSREISTGTPDSGVVMNEDSSNKCQDNGQLVKPDNTSDGSIVADSKSDTLSTTSQLQTVTSPGVNITNSMETEEPAVSTNPVNDNTTWETVADRKKRYLQTIEHSKASRNASIEDDHQPTNTVSQSFTQVDADSDYGNSDNEESTATLSSSQPLLNLTSQEEPKSLTDDSSSDSDMEEMQAPLVLTKVSACDNTGQTSYTNPLLSDNDSSDDEDCEMVQACEVVVHRSQVRSSTQAALQQRVSHPPLQRTLNHEQVNTSYTNPLLSDNDSSDEDCEMVQASEVVVHRSQVKSGTQAALQQRASHPPLQRTPNHEQVNNSAVQRTTKKLRHKPSLKSIIEEDYRNMQTL